MDCDDTFCNKNGLSIIVDVFMFGNLDRLFWIAHIVQFLKGNKVLTAKRRTIKGKGNLYRHFFTVGSECVITVYTFPVNQKFSIFFL